MRLSSRFSFPIAGLFFLAISGVSQAANIHIDDTNPSGSITISWSDFEFGFTVNDRSFTFPGYSIVQSVTVTPTPTLPRVTFSGSWISTSGSGGGATLYFVDPGTNHVRDSLSTDSGVSGSTATIGGTFSSDVPLDLGTLPSFGTAIQITGSSQELVPTYLTIPPSLTVQVVAKLASNQTLGSTGTSSNPSGGISTTINPTVTQSVNTATGNTYIKFSDLIVPGKGPRFSFIRSYNNQDTYSGPLCRGWTHSENILLTVDPTSGAVTIKEADGHQNVFQPGATAGSYTAPTGVYDILAAGAVANTFTLTRPDQTVLAFGPIPPNPLIIRLLSITDKNGNSQTLSYDALGNLISFTDVGGGVFTFTYDASNHLTSLHDVALGRTFAYSCDGTNLTTYTDAAGHVSHYTYDSNNFLSVATDARSNTAISNVFDSLGRVVQTKRTAAAACTTTYSYDDVNHITTITDPRGGVTKHYYDASKRLIKIVNALGLQTTYTYDSNNDVVSVTNPLAKTTTYTYDAHGNRTTVTDPLTNTTQLAYDSKNNLTSETDANLNSTVFGYDGSGNLITVTDALVGVTTYSYDSRGNKVSFKNAKGNTTSYTYDLANHLLSITDPTLKITAFSYDSGGRLVSQTEPDGNTKTLAYDSLGRITSQVSAPVSIPSELFFTGPVSYNYEPSSTGRTTSLLNAGGFFSLASTGASYTYDANGNRASMTDSTGTTNYTHDALNRLTSVTFTFPGPREVDYTYDCNDNRTSISYAGKTVSYTFDAINRLTSVKDGTDAASVTTTCTYDAADSLLRAAYPNGAAVSYSYDAAGRITQVRNTYVGSDGNPISSFSYVLDKVGTRLQVTDGAGKVTTNSYDKLYRLTSTAVDLKSTTYSYDAVGNRLTQNAPGHSTGYTYDAADRLISAGPTTFIYDSNGNQISQTTGKTTITYGYDAANRLISVTGGATASSFTYDGDGNRVSQQVGTNTYIYLNDISDGFTTVLDETGPDGEIHYVRGRGLVSADGPSFTHFYQYDAQSTVAGVTDTTGHLKERYVYDVWGQLLQSVPKPRITTENKFGYTGEALDPGTGLTYLRARYYDPTLGRFISKDTINGFERSPQTLNRYVYVRNNPATLTDRTGHCDDTGFCDGSSGWETSWPDAPALP